MKYALFIMALSFAGCQQDNNTATDVLIGKEFTIRVGQYIVVEGGNLSVTFVNVMEDSRCPDNARCIWSGNAAVRLIIGEANFPATTREINTHLDPRSVNSGAYTIGLVELNPYPHAGSTISPDEYVATLLVSKR